MFCSWSNHQRKGSKRKGSIFLLEIEAVEPWDPRHQDPHAKVVILLGQIAKVVALIDLRLHVVGAGLVGGGVDRSCNERTTREQHSNAVDCSTLYIVAERIYQACKPKPETRFEMYFKQGHKQATQADSNPCSHSILHTTKPRFQISTYCVRWHLARKAVMSLTRLATSVLRVMRRCQLHWLCSLRRTRPCTF